MKKFVRPLLTQVFLILFFATAAFAQPGKVQDVDPSAGFEASKTTVKIGICYADGRYDEVTGTTQDGETVKFTYNGKTLSVFPKHMQQANHENTTRIAITTGFVEKGGKAKKDALFSAHDKAIFFWVWEGEPSGSNRKQVIVSQGFNN